MFFLRRGLQERLCICRVFFPYAHIVVIWKVPTTQVPTTNRSFAPSLSTLNLAGNNTSDAGAQAWTMLKDVSNSNVLCTMDLWWGTYKLHVRPRPHVCLAWHLLHLHVGFICLSFVDFVCFGGGGGGIPNMKHPFGGGLVPQEWFALFGRQLKRRKRKKLRTNIKRAEC